jgi:hypothetical protein
MFPSLLLPATGQKQHRAVMIENSTLKEIYASKNLSISHLVDTWRSQILMDVSDGRLSTNRVIHLSSVHTPQEIALKNWICQFKARFPGWNDFAKLKMFLSNDGTEDAIKMKMNNFLSLFPAALKDFN